MDVTPGVRTCWTARSARMNPFPQSVSGRPPRVQSMALAGLSMVARSSRADIDGFADLTSAATPAALGVAALVPPKGWKPGTEVLTASAPASCGFCRNCAFAGRGAPFLSNRRERQPARAVGLGVVEPGLVLRDRRDRERAAGRRRVGVDRVGGGVPLGDRDVPKFPRAMYFMNGQAVAGEAQQAQAHRHRRAGVVRPERRRRSGCRSGCCRWCRSASAAPVVAFTRNSSTSVTACPHGSSHCSDDSRGRPRWAR